MKILAVAQQKEGKLASASFELLQAAKSVGGDLTCLILAENAKPLADELAARGGGKVVAVSHPSLKFFNDEIHVKVISELIAKYSPDLVLGIASFYGKALFSRLSASCGGPMVSDVSQLTVSDGAVVAVRSNYGGSVLSSVGKSGDGPFFITIRPKIFPESNNGAGEVVEETVADSAYEAKMTVKEVKLESAGTVSVTEADVIVSAGRGIKGPENLPMMQELAHSLSGALGASRAIVDAGWIPYSHQVGQTGKTVNPKLYMAVGISGAIQHLVGMQTSGTIVAVNKDKDAPIFNIANYSIVGDAMEIVPALTKKFKAELKGE